ncbi:hypothetical protein [Phormidium tenue]|uniref:Chromosome segregation ATPase n=1 Tax=Phormidium tenue NIES-30 TaxID=549789 RepID=A0A1U7J924_9CYAN|nr:hypothetical protein [Phormidium tenue]MBD2231026.1 hypothetical protein [Phormidium tenue FACHB-1052]OKH49941.1 hypothetical protein NIES30_04310 [Phormidium tenue NIES-30]
MLSQQQSGPQRGEPLAEGGAKDFSLIIDEADSALGLSEVMVPVPQSGNQSWRLLLITLLGCFAASGAALGAFFWLINLPPTANCDNPASVTTDRAQLFCAQVAAESGELPDVLTALDLAGSWTTGHPLYYEVQPLIEQWSWVVLKAAEQELRSNGSMEQAQALVSHIPVESPVFATAQETMQTWQGEWEQGEAIMATAQTALKQKDWATASQQVLALGELNNSHWRVAQVQALSRQIRLERRAQELLGEAVATAVPGGSDRLAAALRTASQIDESTYARQQVQPYLDRWSDLLLKLGQDKWYASELDAAIALGRSAALNPSRAKAAQELIWISQARQMAQKSLTTWRTSPDQLVTLYQAMLLANRLPADSPYYPQAQSSVVSWRSHMGELARLQTAQAMGQVRTKDTLKSAIGQAAQVPLGHPRRVQAQTMVAHWRQEIERLEDRPQLVKAHELASAKTFESLQEAIQTASGIALHRALRSEAQSWIYIWTSEIQVMEDRPLLNRARSLAQRGQLSQAIVEASSVKPGRALYDEARAAIAGWQGEIAAAERARLRAVERAAARQAEALAAKEDAATEATAAEASLEEATTSPLEEGLPIAPAPATSDSRWPQSPLPDRIDTVPGAAAPAEAGAPELPRSPQPLTAPAAEPNPVDLAPAPLPSAMPPPPLVAPSAPAPPPLELMPDPAAAPAGEPQATQPIAPVISAQPQPEFLTRAPMGFPPAASHNTDVLVSGALYAGY